MVSVPASSAIDRGSEPRSGQTKDYKIGICCFTAKYAALRRKTGLLGIIIMCPSGTTCLPADGCFSELALLKPNSACFICKQSVSLVLYNLNVTMLRIVLLNCLIKK